MPKAKRQNVPCSALTSSRPSLARMKPLEMHSDASSPQPMPFSLRDLSTATVSCGRCPPFVVAPGVGPGAPGRVHPEPAGCSLSPGVLRAQARVVWRRPASAPYGSYPPVLGAEPDEPAHRDPRQLTIAHVGERVLQGSEQSLKPAALRVGVQSMEGGCLCDGPSTRRTSISDGAPGHPGAALTRAPSGQRGSGTHGQSE